jgi:hypothetical protein
MERCVVYIFIVIIIVYYFVQESIESFASSKSFTNNHIEPFEDKIGYNQVRYDLLSCKKFDCMYNKEIACENWCNKLKSEFSKDACLSKCFDYTDGLIYYTKHQNAIFGEAIYDFNPLSNTDFITSVTI